MIAQGLCVTMGLSPRQETCLLPIILKLVCVCVCVCVCVRARARVFHEAFKEFVIILEASRGTQIRKSNQELSVTFFI